jgi:hypothetical protein
MTTSKKTKLDWQIEEHRQERAGKQADELVVGLSLTAPIDPLKVALSERPILATGGRDLGNLYDGKLKFHKAKRKFLLFFNTKYDRGIPDGKHHPRTRFSIAHELGHYFIDEHREFLKSDGVGHPSTGEFINGAQMEREADAFASSLLLPTHLAEPVLNDGELSVATIDKVAAHFQTSVLCTAIRGVKLSDHPCAVAGIRDGRIAWLFRSKPLVEAKCYPGEHAIVSPTARRRWKEFLAGDDGRYLADGKLSHWVRTYDEDEKLVDVGIAEAFIPIRVMRTLVVLLTIDEDDLVDEEDDEEEDEVDIIHRERFGW